MKKLLLGLMICALLFGLAGAAMAEEGLVEGRVELYSQGGFPTNLPVNTGEISRGGFEEYMIAQLKAQAKEIDISAFRMTLEDFVAAYRSMLNAYPEMFFVSGEFLYYPDEPYIPAMLPVYIYEGAELAQMQAIYENGVDEIVDYALKSDTKVGQMLRASDYMCANYEYDEEGLKQGNAIYSPELFFQKGYGVCQAYMLVYRAVLNELGITNLTVGSTEITHTWNMVYLDGSWYHIDVTWNDPITDRPLRAMHDNFLRSDDGITETGHYSWDDSYETVPAADNTKYDDYFWRELYSAASMKGEVVYYAAYNEESGDHYICAYDLEDGSNDHIFTYSYQHTNFHPIWVANGLIYYASENSLYRAAPNTAESEPVYTTDGSEKEIWYLWQDGSVLKMFVSSNPNEPGEVYAYNLKQDVTYALELNPAVVRLDIGDTVQLNAVLTPDADDASDLTWTSADDSISEVDAGGLVTAAGAGVVKITAVYDEKATAECTVVVNAEEVLCLPADTIAVEREAFCGTAPAAVEIPEGVERIEARAFAENGSLLLIDLPESIRFIAEDAFEGSGNVTLLCTAGSAGEEYAAAQNIPYVILPAEDME